MRSLFTELESASRRHSHPDRPMLSAALKRLVATRKAHFADHELLAGNSEQITEANRLLYRLALERKLSIGVFENPATNRLNYILGDSVCGDKISDGTFVVVVLRAETDLPKIPITSCFLGFDDQLNETIRIVMVYFEPAVEAVRTIFEPTRQEVNPLFYCAFLHDALIHKMIEAGIMQDGMHTSANDLPIFTPVLFSQQPQLAFFNALGMIDEPTCEAIKRELGCKSAYELLFYTELTERAIIIARARVAEALKRTSFRSIDELITREERDNIARLIYGRLISDPEIHA